MVRERSEVERMCSPHGKRLEKQKWGALSTERDQKALAGQNRVQKASKTRGYGMGRS